MKLKQPGKRVPGASSAFSLRQSSSCDCKLVHCLSWVFLAKKDTENDFHEAGKEHAKGKQPLSANDREGGNH